MNIKLTAVTDIGLERDLNEDAVLVCSNLNEQDWGIPELKDFTPLSLLGALSVVADGMGGANAGEVASDIAINTIREQFKKECIPSNLLNKDSIEDHLLSSIIKANVAINDYVKDNPDAIGLGTTILVLWLIGDKAYVAWCGDSRCYSFNPKSGLRRITKDHSYVQSLIDNGEITEEEALSHPDSNIITRCLGDVDREPNPEVKVFPITNGDILLSCSDGLCGYCQDQEIEDILYSNYKDIDKCKELLLNYALKTGGHDNITLSLISISSDPSKMIKIPLSVRIKRFFK